MTLPKHAPARLSTYLRVHTTRTEAFFLREFFLQTNASLDAAPGKLILAGQYLCRGGLMFTVEKLLLVLDAGAPDPRVQTLRYSYNLSVIGHGSVFRYDNVPHHAHPDPHHRHAFDWRTGVEAPKSPRHVGEAGWPTMSEAAEEAERWQGEHAAELPGLAEGFALSERYAARVIE